MSRKAAKSSYARGKIYQFLGQIDESIKMTEGEKLNQKKDYAPADAPIQCQDCKLVRTKCYNPMRKKFGENFQCEKKVKKEELK